LEDPPGLYTKRGSRHDMFTMFPGLGRLTDHYRLTTKGPRAAV
jgi:hypothetical protein